jgi:hypothetical protein
MKKILLELEQNISTFSGTDAEWVYGHRKRFGEELEAPPSSYFICREPGMHTETGPAVATPLRVPAGEFALSAGKKRYSWPWHSNCCYQQYTSD